MAIALYNLPPEPAPQDLTSAKPVVIHERHPIAVPAQQWSYDDVHAIARTLAGECYEDMPQDKRLVCEVILNRVSDDRFANTITDVLETPNAFNGYWHPSRGITENDRHIAEQALADWYANDCQPLSDIRFFCSGEGRTNYFY